MLIGIHPQIEQSRQAQTCEWIGPDIQLARLPLFAEDDLPCGRTGCSGFEDIEPHRDQVAIVVKVVILGAVSARLLASEIRQLIETIQVHLECFASDTGALE